MQLSDFPIQSYDKVRYADCDPQGHVNNAVFSVFLETGRCDLVAAIRPDGAWKDDVFVIARLELDYVAEVFWRGQVEIGTAVLKLGNSSINLEQVIFQNGELVAKAKTILVHLGTDRRPASLPEAQRAGLTKLIRA